MAVPIGIPSTVTTSLASLIALSSNAKVDQVVDLLRREGEVIVADMVVSAELDRFNSDLKPCPDRVPFGEAGFTGTRTRRCGALFAKSMTTADLLMQPLFIGVREAILADDYSYPHATGETTVRTTLQVSATQAIQIWPE